jgi:PAS domain S-box-containing protein
LELVILLNFLRSIINLITIKVEYALKEIDFLIFSYDPKNMSTKTKKNTNDKSESAGRKENKIGESPLILRFKQFDENLAVAELSPDMKIIDADKNFHQLFGYLSGSLINSFHSILLKDSKEEESELIRKVNKGEQVKGEFKRITKSGEEIILKGVYSPVYDDLKRLIRVVNVYNNENKLSKSNKIKINKDSINDPVGSVLIVEDEALIAYSMKELLTGEGYDEVQICKSGEEALLIFKTLNPSLIIMDYSLKGAITGLQASIEIQKTLSCPIIFISAFYKDLKNLNASIKNSYFLDKPVDRRKLTSLLNSIRMKVN